jgi:mono/diheme cytochrome c family protein
MPPARRYSWLAGGIAAACLWLGATGDGPRADEALTNPYLGDAEAIAEGRRFYRTRCIICHRNAGGRGPNLFGAKISDERFLETVINGRKGTQMPAFGLRMSPDDVWMVHAFVKSAERY